MSTFACTGGARIGTRRASRPFATLTADPSELSIATPIGSIAMSPVEVVALRAKPGFWFFDGRLVVEHTRDDRRVIFRCRDPEGVRTAILRAGFAPSGRPGGGPDPTRAAAHALEDRRDRFGVALAVAGILLLLTAIGGGAIAAIFFGLSHSDAYTASLAAVRASTAVADRLGAPLAGGWPSGSIETTNASGRASLRYRVDGPKGSADVAVEATEADDRWTIRRLTVAPESGGEGALHLVDESAPGP